MFEGLLDPKLTSALSGYATVAGILVAIWGLTLWKKQTRFNAAFDLARRFIVLANKFDYEFGAAQFTIPSDVNDRVPSEDETPETARLLNRRAAYLSRLNPLVELLHEMKAAGWEAQVVAQYNLEPLIARYKNTFDKMRDATFIVYDIHYEDWMRTSDEARTQYLKDKVEAEQIIKGFGKGKELREEAKQITQEVKVLLKSQVSKDKERWFLPWSGNNR